MKDVVDFKAYWIDEKASKVSCLCEAPNPEAVTAAHKAAHGVLPSKKDLAVEGKYEVSRLDYWVDPASGTVMRKEAHGLVPKSMDEVVQGTP